MLSQEDMSVRAGGALNVGRMEAMIYADGINKAAAREGREAVDLVNEEVTGVGLPTLLQRREQYQAGDDLLKQYSIQYGFRTPVPFAVDGTAADARIVTADAWLCIESGYLASQRAYRFVRFYQRQEAAHSK